MCKGNMQANARRAGMARCRHLHPRLSSNERDRESQKRRETFRGHSGISVRVLGVSESDQARKTRAFSAIYGECRRPNRGDLLAGWGAWIQLGRQLKAS